MTDSWLSFPKASWHGAPNSLNEMVVNKASFLFCVHVCVCVGQAECVTISCLLRTERNWVRAVVRAARNMTSASHCSVAHSHSPAATSTPRCKLSPVTNTYRQSQKKATLFALATHSVADNAVVWTNTNEIRPAKKRQFTEGERTRDVKDTFASGSGYFRFTLL